MKQLNLLITVPSGEQCNLSTKLCRFCSRELGTLWCCLFESRLRDSTMEYPYYTATVFKCDKCKEACGEQVKDG